MPTTDELKAMTEHNNLHRELHAMISDARKNCDFLLGIIKAFADAQNYDLVITKQGGGMVKAEWVSRSPIVRL